MPAKTREQQRQYEAAYREKNREKINARNRARQAEYREQNRQKINERARDYASRVAHKKRSYMQEWCKQNQEHLREKRVARYKTDPSYRVRINLRNRLNAAIRVGCKAGSAVRDLGCTIEDFMSYIAAQFLPGMSWENWGEWHLDHIKPLSAFDLTNRNQFLAACHYTNMRPLWAADNLRKGQRIV